MSAHTPTNHENDPPPKTTLFCPTCGHESGPDGDWTVREADRREASDGAAGGTGSRRAGQGEAPNASHEFEKAVLECPVCGTDIATRGRSEVARGCCGSETPADD